MKTAIDSSSVRRSLVSQNTRPLSDLGLQGLRLRLVDTSGAVSLVPGSGPSHMIHRPSLSHTGAQRRKSGAKTVAVRMNREATRNSDISTLTESRVDSDWTLKRFSHWVTSTSTSSVWTALLTLTSHFRHFLLFSH